MFWLGSEYVCMGHLGNTVYYFLAVAASGAVPALLALSAHLLPAAWRRRDRALRQLSIDRAKEAGSCMESPQHVPAGDTNEPERADSRGRVHVAGPKGVAVAPSSPPGGIARVQHAGKKGAPAMLNTPEEVLMVQAGLLVPERRLRMETYTSLYPRTVKISVKVDYYAFIHAQLLLLLLLLSHMHNTCTRGSSRTRSFPAFWNTACEMSHHILHGICTRPCHHNHPHSIRTLSLSSP